MFGNETVTPELASLEGNLSYRNLSCRKWLMAEAENRPFSMLVTLQALLRAKLFQSIYKHSLQSLNSLPHQISKPCGPCERRAPPPVPVRICICIHEELAELEVSLDRSSHCWLQSSHHGSFRNMYHHWSFTGQSPLALTRSLLCPTSSN